ncbi:relaxation protein, partial [Xanthomonas perforans]|nr:relaxation protein [Xanthomonas perforans]
MDVQDPMALVSKAAMLMEQFERRCAELEQLER